ncbi:MAG TPA: TraR/DksA family transcriptional regulator [Acidiferrobacterales bacterium]|nr:TraR/DksA family transcriptional regulator [Acidiferrobacterales bacterium]
MASLTPSEVTRFRDRLRARDLELRQTIHSALVNAEDKTYAEVAGRVLDVAEESVATMFADDKILMIKKEVAEQTDVVAALARITDGTYGACVDCAEDIGVKRLDAYPTAKRCIRCQTHYERQYQSGGRDTTPSL